MPLDTCGAGRQHGHTHMAMHGLQQLVDRLDALDPASIDSESVRTLIAEASIPDSDLAPFITPREDKYARMAVHRSRWFDMMVLTWMPGQVTPIHNHAGSLGWMRLVRGRMLEERFHLVPSTAAVGLDLAPDVAEPRRGIELVADERNTLTQVGSVATVDKHHAIHRISNPREHVRDDVAVTLHVYSKPHDVCLTFDPVARCCARRELRFDEPTSAR